jgi:hypothetical protein
VAQALSSSRRGVDPAVVPVGMDSLCDLMERFIDVGFSKFVVRPMEAPHAWRQELVSLAEAIGDLQT